VTPQPPFIPREMTLGTHWTGGWVGPRAGLDTPPLNFGPHCHSAVKSEFQNLLLHRREKSKIHSSEDSHSSLCVRYLVGSRSSSVSVVSDYGLTTGVGSPAEAASSLCIHTGSRAHPASCPMGTGGTLPGGKAQPGRDADHSPHLVPWSRVSRSYTSSPPSAYMACNGTGLAF
jgi:hypothetical protein